VKGLGKKERKRYTIDYSKPRKKYEFRDKSKVELRAEVIREAQRRFASGDSAKDIAASLEMSISAIYGYVSKKVRNDT